MRILYQLYRGFAVLGPVVFLATSVHAGPALQSDDPVDQCSQGVELYLDDKSEEALPLLQSGFANRDTANFADPEELAFCALALGKILGNTPQAQQAYLTALDLFQASGNREFEQETLSNLGMTYLGRGWYSQALDVFLQALEITRERGDREGEASLLHNLGSSYEGLGQYAEALASYQQALIIEHESGNKEEEAATLNNIGIIYALQGQFSDALASYNEALKIAPEIDSPGGVATTLSNIGLLYQSQGRFEEALDKYQQALALVRQMDDPVNEGAILNGLGMIYESQGRYDEALAQFEQVLAITQELGDRANEGTVLNNIGAVYQDMHRYSEALAAYEQALAIAIELENHWLEGTTLNNIGFMYEDQSKFQQAVEYYEKAIDVLESLRSNIGTEGGRASFIAQYSHLYDHAIQIYIEERELEKAFLVSERGRSRAFLDALATGYIELNDDRSVALFQSEQEAYSARQEAEAKLAFAKSQKPVNEESIADLQAKLAQTETAYQAALDAISSYNNRLSQLIPGRSRVLDVRSVQSLLDEDTTLLSYWVIEDRTFVFVVTRNSLEAAILDLSRSELKSKVKSFRSFASIDSSHPDITAILYQDLFALLEGHLKTRHLIIVPHGDLHYLPFASLSDGSRFLINDYVITYLPSASSLAFLEEHEQEANGKPLILGNPSTGDYDTWVSLMGQRDQFGPLPFAEQEAKEIAGQLNVQPFLKGEATETLVKQQAAQTKILHLAAHGLFNSKAPLNSLIALAPDQENDGWLTVSEVYGLDLHNTDLVVLSACDTQIGQLTAGDEFVGLTRGFFFAGTPTVVASLWSVDDQATALLMERFYAHMQEGMGKAEALRQAQMDVRAKYPNPYYWAAFVLSGDVGTPNQPVSGLATEPASTPSKPICSSAMLAPVAFIMVAFTIKRHPRHKCVK